MNLKQIKGSQKIDEITVVVKKVYDSKTVTSKKSGDELALQNVEVTDASLEPKTVQLTFWVDDVGKYSVGDQLKITNLYSKIWETKVQLRMTRESVITQL